MSIQSLYRPHNPGHDYYDEGVYHITLVVGGRDCLLGQLNMDVMRPKVDMTEMGLFLQNQWQKTIELQAKRGNHIELHAQICMPDHWHGVIEVHNRMNWSLGDIIQAVKAACTSHWRMITGYTEPQISAQRVRHMSHENRSRYYATLPREQRPFFDDDYDDTICFPRNIDVAEHERHKAAMIHYVNDNPRRSIVMKLHPDFFERKLHIVIKGMDKQGKDIERHFAAFGNLYLLRWARKIQVMCHRKARFGILTDEEKLSHRMAYDAVPDYVTNIPYEQTQAFRHQHNEIIDKVMAGGTVVVTPGISAGEKTIKKECLEKGIPLIHIQKDPINAFWKPETERFLACQRGTLLIIAPWHADEMGKVNGVPQDSLYSIFHNLNDVARDVCEWRGEARIDRWFPSNITK